MIDGEERFWGVWVCADVRSGYYAWEVVAVVVVT